MNENETIWVIVQIMFIMGSLLIIDLLIVTKKQKKNNYNYNYNYNYNKNNAFKKKNCLTQTELFFYRHLRKMIKDEYKIDPQIVISSIIEAKHYNNWNKINRKTIDFVIRDKNLNTILGIELDDYSHNYYNRIQRDNFVNEVFEDAGIQLIHIKTNTSYEKEIKTKIPEYLLK